MKKHALLQLGNMLQRGPDSIHESRAIGSVYACATTSLFWNCTTYSTFRSCRIYCDACGDEETGFLPPLARISEWDRGANLKAPTEWPRVNVELFTLDHDCDELQQHIQALQRRLDTTRLTHFGLPVRRDFGDTDCGELGHLAIHTQAGSQSIDRAFWISEMPDLANVLDDIQGIIRKTGEPADLDRWVERYDQSPEEIAANTSWEWDCKQPPT